MWAIVSKSYEWDMKTIAKIIQISPTENKVGNFFSDSLIRF